MASSLILHKRIATTLAKAKALRVYVEPLLTKAKEDTTHSRRIVFSYLQNKEAVTELFREISVKIADRPGGYTRILRTGFRQGDNAEMCIIELVDYNENMLKDKSAKKATRTRRSSRKADVAGTTAKTETSKPTVEKAEKVEPEAVKVEETQEEVAVEEPKATEAEVKVEPDTEAPATEEEKAE
jgi:large subunit ribosomal protein L17